MSSSALDAIESLLATDELDVQPTTEELSKAVDSLASDEALGSDGISPEFIKQCKPTLLPPLHYVLCRCWEEGPAPQDMRDDATITLYKDKDVRSDRNGYRSLSLLSIAERVFTRLILLCRQKSAKRVYNESQCGFRAKRSTTGTVFCLRKIQEKCREEQIPLYLSFISLTKAFDLVSRDGLFEVIPKLGCPLKLKSLIESSHTDMKGTLQFNSSTSKLFAINSGVKQGYTNNLHISASLFLLYCSTAPSVQQQRLSTYILNQTAVRRPPVSELRPNYMKFSSES